MRAECIGNTNFQGKLVLLNELSRKPGSCIEKVKKDLQEMIKPKNYDLYLEQDYSTNKINFAASTLYPRCIHGAIEHEELPITAKPKRYINAAKDTMDNYEKALNEKEQQAWEQKQKHQKTEDLKDFAGIILFFPLFAINDLLHEINPKWSKKFEKFIDKII